MERWTFLVLAGNAGMRITLRAGDDESKWPVLQVGPDGAEVPIDDTDRDYEAPEWKAKQIVGEDRLDALKEKLRDQV